MGDLSPIGHAKYVFEKSCYEVQCSVESSCRRLGFPLLHLQLGHRGRLSLFSQQFSSGPCNCPRFRMVEALRSVGPAPARSFYIGSVHRPLSLLVRHRTNVQRTSGSHFDLFDQLECPVSGNRAAKRQGISSNGQATDVDFAASASGGSVRNSVISPSNFAAVAASICFSSCDAARSRGTQFAAGTKTAANLEGSNTELWTKYAFASATTMGCFVRLVNWGPSALDEKIEEILR